MHRLILTFVAMLVYPPQAGFAQSWQQTAPAIGVSATLTQVRQYRAGSEVNLSFGQQGIEGGVDHLVQPTASDPVSGSSAKLSIRFNAGTRVIVSGSALTANAQSIQPVYHCVVADDHAGTNLARFPNGCEDGYEWPGESVNGLLERSILIGAALPAAETASKPAGSYSGTISVMMVASDS